MDDAELNRRIGLKLKALREAEGLTLDALSGRSGVSRSNISLIERGRSSPTAVVLDKLSAALGATVAALFEPVAAPAAQPLPVARVAEQPVWADPATGYLRRNVSPPVGSPLQLVDVVFPAGARIAYDATPRESVEVHQQVWVIDGQMQVTVGAAAWRLQPGDCLAMQLDQPIVFHNPTRRQARYLVALASLPRPRR